MNNPMALGAVVGVCLLSVGIVQAQVRSFDGGGNGTSWSDANNWSENDAPDTLGEAPSIDVGGAWDVISSGGEISAGPLTLGSDDTLTISNTVTLSGINSLSGELIVSPGANISVDSSWQNDGIITLNEFGLLSTPNTANSITNNASGLIRGELFILPLGFITGTLINHGTISPGFSADDGKSLSITADATLSSTSVLDIEVGGGTTNSSFDTIAGLGNVTLGGELKLTRFNDYTPSPSTTLTIVDSVYTSGITGSFSNVADGERLVTTDGSGSWLVQYGPGYANSDVVITDFQLTLGLPGDLNGDGFVGITDLNIVLGNWNQNVPPGDPLADPSADGFVGIDDLNTVLGNWNAGTPPVGVLGGIPEPSTLALLAVCGVSLAGRSRGRR
jgi:hypothetical protein